MAGIDFAAMVRRRLEEKRQSKHRAALDHGLPQDAIRSVLNGHSPGLDRVEEICGALGLELYIGPVRDADGALAPRPLTSFNPSVKLPVHRWAHCSPEGYLTPASGTRLDRAPAPVDLTDPHAFYARVPGFTMVPAGLEADNYCLISPCGQLKAGQRVWLRSRTGQQTIKWLIELTPTAYELRAWRPPDPPSGRQELIADRWMREAVVDRGVVVAVYRDRPSVKGKTHRAADWRPERVAARWRSELQDPQMVKVDPSRMGNEKPEGSLTVLHGEVDKLKQSTTALERSRATLHAQIAQINEEVSQLKHSTSTIETGMADLISQVVAVAAALDVTPPGQKENGSDGGQGEDG